MRFTLDCARGPFGIVTVSAPCLNAAETLSSSTSSTGIHRSKRPSLRRRAAAPEFLRCNLCALRKRLEPCPRDGGVDPLRERAFRKPAIGAVHDVLVPDDLCPPPDALGRQPRMV